MHKKPYSKYNTYGQLRTVVLGSYYPSEYFNFIDIAAVRDPLKIIAQEINEDLNYFESMLQQHGVTVLRPALPTIEEFIGYYEQNQKFLSPPLQVRDYHSVIGDKIYQFDQPSSQITQTINACITQDYNEVIDLTNSNRTVFKQSMILNSNYYNQTTDLWYCHQKYQELAGPDWPTFYDYVQGDRSDIPFIQKELIEFTDALCYETKEVRPLCAPNIFPLDDTIIIDCNEYCNYTKWFAEQTGYTGRITHINTKAGHTDGCFVVLGNNVILGITPLIDYPKYFPGYKIIEVPTQNYMSHINNFKIMKQNRVGGRWWIPGEENNQELINYVEEYLSEWTGHVYETVFDVNVLAINPDTVFVSSYNKFIADQLLANGINSVVIPWRHRFFVDCGLHCITLDLCRDK